jgi:16S rRNA processing protein RimM
MVRATAIVPPAERLEEREPWVEVGRVVRAHGLGGALSVTLYGDDPSNLIESGRVRLEGIEGREGAEECRVERAEAAGFTSGGRARARLWLEGLSGRGEAEERAGACISIPESALRPLPAGEFYWRDVIGLECRALDGTLVGTVEEIWPTAASDLLVVRVGERTVLVPAAAPILDRVDIEGGTVWIDPPEGLLEEGG